MEPGLSSELSHEARPRAVWFPWSTRDDAGYFHLLVNVIALDFVTKGVADWLVPRGKVDPLAPLQFVLRPNHGLGASLREDIKHPGGAQLLLGVGVAAVATAACMWLTRRRTMTLRRRALLNVGAFFLSGAIASSVAYQFGEIPTLALRLFLRPAGIVFWMTLWRLVTPGLWKVAITFFAASVLANGLSEMLPPFGVVTNSIHSSVYSPKGTFNFAEAYSDVGKVLLSVAAAASLFRRIKRGRGPSAI